MQKPCNQCPQPFEITDDDLKFYEKVSPVVNGKRYDIPPPNSCPNCRSQQRLAFRNERSLYKRKCDLTGKDIVSIYSPDRGFTVYNTEDWYSDTWDELTYGRDYDFNRPFFEQFMDLKKVVPRMALHVNNMENSPYVNQCWNDKNIHMCFDVGFCENVYYSYGCYHSQDCIDCVFARNSELSAFLLDSQNCYRSYNLQNCSQCHNACYSFDCHQCSNVAFCSNLRNKKNHIFNKPVSEEAFHDFIQKVLSGSYAEYQKNMNRFENEVLKKAIHKENHNVSVENCSGDYLLKSRNCYHCYDIEDCEDLKYCTRVDEKLNNSMDIDHAAFGDTCYNGAIISGHHNLFGVLHLHANDCLYCDTMVSSSDCFGSIALKHKKYCILNKQYTKEQYEELLPKIIQHMKETGEWGEFFPGITSPFAYNETMAIDFYPLSKKEVEAKGFYWSDYEASPPKVEKTIGKEQMGKLPDNIKNIPDEIVNWALTCVKTGKLFRIIPQELKFYREHKLPIPRMCSDERNNELIAYRNPRKLWERKCGQCGKGIQTSYDPERVEQIYCEECYLGAVY